ncbi:hypothetical protein ABZ397_29635 [Streptomyces sp. NPDC005876]|uniref:hypothetical protein n=1 Tax=Streptomyces sp. NPDC005876 TaxID=3157076 RepID=UPI0033BFFB60
MQPAPALAWLDALAELDTGQVRELAQQLMSDRGGHFLTPGEALPLRPILMRRSHLMNNVAIGTTLIRLSVANAQRRCADDPGRLKALLGQEPVPGAPSPFREPWHAGTWQADIAPHQGVWRFTGFGRGMTAPNIAGRTTLGLAYERSLVARLLKAGGASLVRPDPQGVWARSTLQAARRAVRGTGALRIGLLLGPSPSPEEEQEVEKEAGALRRLGVKAARVVLDDADVVFGRVADRDGPFDVVVHDRATRAVPIGSSPPERLRELRASASGTVFLQADGDPLCSHDVLLAWLYEARHEFGPRYTRLIHDHVPATFVVDDRPVLIEGVRTSLLTHLETQREHYVLKGAVSQEGGTLVGRAAGERQWSEALDRSVRGHSTVVAQRVTQDDEVPVPLWSDGEVREEGTFRVPTSALYCGGEYAGALVRLSSSGSAMAQEGSPLHSVLLTLDP